MPAFGNTTGLTVAEAVQIVREGPSGPRASQFNLAAALCRKAGPTQVPPDVWDIVKRMPITQRIPGWALIGGLGLLIFFLSPSTVKRK